MGWTTADPRPDEGRQPWDRSIQGRLRWRRSPVLVPGCGPAGAALAGAGLPGAALAGAALAGAALPDAGSPGAGAARRHSVPGRAAEMCRLAAAGPGVVG